MTNENNFITLTCVNNNGSHCSNLFLGTDANGNNHTITISLDVDKLVEEKGVGIAEMQKATLTLRGDVIGQLQSCTAQYSTGEQSVVEYVAENGEVSLPIDLRPLLFAETPTLTLINANQQGGLQITDTQIHIENSDNIATVFSENIGEMYSINEETGEYSESLVCSNQNRIYLHANISNPFGEYTVLKFKLSKPTSGRFPVYLATPADEDVATGYYLVTGIPIGYLGYYSVGNECFAEIDITNLAEENVCLCIKPEVGSAHFTGEMFCEKISHSESDFQDNGSHIQKSFGAK